MKNVKKWRLGQVNEKGFMWIESFWATKKEATERMVKEKAELEANAKKYGFVPDTFRVDRIEQDEMSAMIDQLVCTVS